MMGGLQPPQQTAEGAIEEQMHDLSLEIYARLAVQHLAADHYTQPLSREHLRALAEHSQIAAQAFFEAMGVQFDHQEPTQ